MITSLVSHTHPLYPAVEATGNLRLFQHHWRLSNPKDGRHVLINEIVMEIGACHNHHASGS